jgi:hypothetical protein
MRAGEPMQALGDVPRSDYRIIMNRGHSRSQLALWPFGIEDPIPSIPVPLMSEEPEPTLALNAVWHALYVRARFDLRVDYRKEPVPSLSPEQAALARKFMTGLRTEGPAGEGTERA